MTYVTYSNHSDQLIKEPQIILSTAGWEKESQKFLFLPSSSRALTLTPQLVPPSLSSSPSLLTISACLHSDSPNYEQLNVSNTTALLKTLLQLQLLQRGWYQYFCFLLFHTLYRRNEHFILFPPLGLYLNPLRSITLTKERIGWSFLDLSI